MRLKSFISLLAAVGLVAGCSQQPTSAASAKPAAQDNLLFRVQFAGTSALMANTNAAYLTNFSTLPETAALSTQIVARLASLPARFLGAAPTNDQSARLHSLFTELLRAGFTLELRGGTNGVTGFALATKTTEQTAPRWEDTWQEAGLGALTMKRAGGWLFAAGSKTDAAAVLAALQQTVAEPKMEAGQLVQIELAASLIPGPIQRSVYGGFSWLKLSVTPDNQAFKIRGTADYEHDLPKLGALPAIPADLVTEPVISFTMVREPGAWLEPKSPLRRVLPNPVPDVTFFWGGQSSPYQLFMALPFAGRDNFNTKFGPALRDQLVSLAKLIENVTVRLDTNESTLRMQTVPFVAPKVAVKQSGTNDYLLAEIFPGSDTPVGLTPALLERVSDRTNLLLYDWEYTQLRFDSWFRIGQLTLLLSGHQQHIGGTASLKWVQKVQLNTTSALNTSTEILQTGPRELTLNRRAPLALTSLELFWLANWLESTNFPAANFLMPLAPPAQ